MTIIVQPEVVAPGHRRTDGQRLDLLVGAWLASYGNDLTRRAYRSDIRAWLAFCERYQLDPLDVRRSHVEVFMRELEANGLAPGTVARRLCGTSYWYGWLVDEGYVAVSPTTRVKRPRVPAESPRTWLGRLELAQWLDAAERIGGDAYALACL